MRLSVLIPVFNVADYVPALLDKLLPGLPDDVEVICYDDASPDDSALIIGRFQVAYPTVHLRLLRGQRNVGITQVRHLLLQASAADYVWFVDSDDWVEADAVARIMVVLQRFAPDVVLFDYDVFYDETNAIKSHESLSIRPVNTLLHNSGSLLYRVAVLDGKHYFWNKVFRRALIPAWPDLDIPAYEDITYTPVLLHQCQTFYYLPVSLLHYRIWGQSIVQKMGLRQAYGIQAYLTQADYAATVVNDQKSQAYLLYKAAVYYERWCAKLATSSLTAENQRAWQQLGDQLYAQKKQSAVQILGLLLRQGMWGKALKLALILLVHRRRA